MSILVDPVTQRLVCVEVEEAQSESAVQYLPLKIHLLKVVLQIFVVELGATELHSLLEVHAKPVTEHVPTP